MHPSRMRFRAPPSYAEAENGRRRHAYSYESRANGTAYALGYGP